MSNLPLERFCIACRAVWQGTPPRYEKHATAHPTFPATISAKKSTSSGSRRLISIHSRGCGAHFNLEILSNLFNARTRATEFIRVLLNGKSVPCESFTHCLSSSVRGPPMLK